eukprot:2604736-Prymnesium_polylepis.1
MLERADYEDRTALDAQEHATEHGLSQSLPPTSILTGLPAADVLFATHPVGESAVGSSWGWLSLSCSGSTHLAALRLCTYPPYGDVKPTGIYLVELLASLDRQAVPTEAASRIQSAIRLGEAMDEADKEEVASATARPEFELLVLRKGRLAISRHAPESEHSSSFCEFSLVRVTCGRFEMIMPFAPFADGPSSLSSPQKLGAAGAPDGIELPPDEVRQVLGAGNGLRPVASIAHVSHTPSRWNPPLMERLRERLRSFSDSA